MKKKVYTKKLNSPDEIQAKIYYKNPIIGYPLPKFCSIMVTDITELMTTGMVKFKCGDDVEATLHKNDLLKLINNINGGYAD